MLFMPNELDEASRRKREREILAYLQQRMRVKAIEGKPGTRREKTAAKNMTCTFCRGLIPQGTAYVSFRSHGGVTFKGKSLRTERMHGPCLSRYMRPGAGSFAR